MAIQKYTSFGMSSSGVSSSSSSSSSEIDLGTTLVALKFDNGVIVGADTRTSVSGYVSNKLARKINPVISTRDISCVICRSGSAADTQWLCQQTSQKLFERTYRYNNSKSSSTTVSQVAQYLKSIVVAQKDQLQASLICAGVSNSSPADDNDDDDGDSVGRIFWIASSGALWEEDVFCVSGSGSTVLLGHLDSMQFLTKDNLLSEQEAQALVTKLLRLSIGRDGSSGGLIRIMIMRKGEEIEELTVYPEPSPTQQSSSKELPGFASAVVTKSSSKKTTTTKSS
eukprot:scaffold23505_cov119-Cylindrotheca_fusiformis.AAC.12